MANIKQVAALANLSVACVSKYLKNPESVLSSNREQIELAIKKLNYVPSSMARNLRRQRTGIIKVISHNITNPFFAELFEMIRNILEKSGYITTLQSIHYMEQKGFSFRDFEQCDGVILCFIENEKTLISIHENIPKGFPVINIHGEKTFFKAPTIVIDVKKGAYNATNYLIESGCRHLSYIGANENSTISRLKLSGFLESIKNHSRKTDYTLAINYDFTMQSGYEATNQLLIKNPTIDCIFCENDLFAAGAVHSIVDHDKKVPEDIKIIGFDNIPLASMFLPTLSSVSIPSYDICTSACEELVSLLTNKSTNDHYFLPELELRMSI